MWPSQEWFLSSFTSQKERCAGDRRFWAGLARRAEVLRKTGTFKPSKKSCTTPNQNYLGGRNRAAKEYNIFLAVLLNNQEKYISWRFDKTAKETCHFLGCSAKPPSKHAISLAVGLKRQVNVQFPWLFDMCNFLGCLTKPPSSMQFPWLFD